MISIFLLVPAIIAVVAVRSYRQCVRQEKQEAAAAEGKPAAALRSADKNAK